MLANNETCVPFDLKPPSKYYIHSLQAKLIYLPQGFGIELGNSWIVDLVFIEYLIQSLLVLGKHPAAICTQNNPI